MPTQYYGRPGVPGSTIPPNQGNPNGDSGSGGGGGGGMTRISKALTYAVCRFKKAVCSKCDEPLKNRPAISKSMGNRVYKRPIKYYCVPCAFKLHVITPEEAETLGIEIPEDAA